MSLLTNNPKPVSSEIVFAIIVGVLAFTAFLGWLMWRMTRAVERAERYPRYLRRWLIFFGALYSLGAVTSVFRVMSGEAPILSLIGLPIPVLIAWYFFRAAIRKKVSSQ